MPIPRAVANFNRRVTNPIQRLWAPRLPLFALIEHTGRKSGKQYTTPVTAFVKDNKVAVMLNYGQESDWVRNIRAAGTAGVVHRGKHYALTSPRIIPSDSPDLPRAAKLVFGSVSDGALYATITEG